jgi:hypothetical protein
MVPPSHADFAIRFTIQGVPVDVVWMQGTRIYYPIVADWIDQEARVTRRQRSLVRRTVRNPPPR